MTTHSIRGFVAVLKELGHWPAVRAEVLRRDPFASHWIDSVADGTWCPLDRGGLLVEAARGLLGDDAIRDLGSRRFARAMDTGVLAPMLRSWARSVAPDTTTLVKLTPHLWRAASQGLGEMKVLEVRPGQARLRFTSDHPTFLACHAWHIFLEGFALGLVALRRGEATPVGPADRAAMRRVDDHLELELTWAD
ncbi:MAG: hypothetical protein K1X94_05040 [Sandaracinaceae bacterium]|nr:hypothetical protein [Sandaracinaceae bacterium]